MRQVGVMVDADTGHIYPLPATMTASYETKNSSLLVQNPLGESC